MSQVYSKAFDLRSKANGKYREHAFVLEEMAKSLLNHKNKLILDYSEISNGDIDRSNQDIVPKRSFDIKTVSKMDKVVSFLVQMSG